MSQDTLAGEGKASLECKQYTRSLISHAQFSAIVAKYSCAGDSSAKGGCATASPIGGGHAVPPMSHSMPLAITSVFLCQSHQLLRLGLLQVATRNLFDSRRAMWYSSACRWHWLKKGRKRRLQAALEVLCADVRVHVGCCAPSLPASINRAQKYVSVKPLGESVGTTGWKPKPLSWLGCLLWRKWHVAMLHKKQNVMKVCQMSADNNQNAHLKNESRPTRCTENNENAWMPRKRSISSDLITPVVQISTTYFTPQPVVRELGLFVP